MVPIVKKGEGRRVKECRRVTLLISLYKVYVTVLAEWLNSELEMKRIIPQNQMGFRIRKENKPADTPAGYRPICLLDEEAKLLERVIAG